MRTIELTILALTLSCTMVSIINDHASADPEGLACRLGLCRKDQLLATLTSGTNHDQDTDKKAFNRLVATAPADAYAWAMAAENANMRGAAGEARTALNRAVELAPATAPILMRRLNFCVEQQDRPCALNDGRAILQLTGAYDGVIFMYYTFLGAGVEDTLKLGLPKEARAMRSFAIQVAKSANSVSDVMLAWERVRSHGSADEATACRLVQHLTGRDEPAAAWRVWKDYLSSQKIEIDSSNQLTDGEFKRNPMASPFDWSIRPQPGVSFERRNGLLVRFAGETNMAMHNVSQMSYVRPVQHRLVVDVSHDGLTTNQGPFLRLVDAENPARLNLQTEMFQGSSPRHRIEMDFTVPEGTRLVRVQLERAPSEKFDNKIAGTLHLHGISLTETAASR